MRARWTVDFWLVSAVPTGQDAIRLREATLLPANIPVVREIGS